MAPKILVLGAGELGTAILTSLSKLSPPETQISVLLRPATISSASPSKAKTLSHLKSLNVYFLPGDIATATISELASLFTPYDLIISCLGYASGPGSQLKITRAVLQAQVKRFIPWQFGADYEIIGRGSAQPVWDEQLDVRDLLRSPGNTDTEWIIVSTGLFMSFLFEPFFGVVEIPGAGEGAAGEDDRKRDVTVRALGSWETEVTVTTPEDIGRLTAMIVFSWQPRFANEVVFIAGETLNYERLADIVERVIIGREVKREVWSLELLKKELEEDPENVVRRYRVAFAEGKGVSWPKEATFNGVRGIDVTGIEEFARKKLVAE